MESINSEARTQTAEHGRPANHKGGGKFSKFMDGNDVYEMITNLPNMTLERSYNWLLNLQDYIDLGQAMVTLIKNKKDRLFMYNWNKICDSYKS